MLISPETLPTPEEDRAFWLEEYRAVCIRKHALERRLKLHQTEPTKRERDQRAWERRQGQEARH